MKIYIPYMYDTTVDNIKTHILTIFQKSCCLWDNVEKYLVPGRPDDNMVHAHCMLDISGYRHTQNM